MRNLFLKNALLFSFISLSFLCSCSDDDKDEIKEKDATLKLISSKAEIAPLEEFKVNIDIDADLFYNSYDSIVWEANGTSYNWLEASLLFQHGREIWLTDYKIGKHKACVFGYKDGIIVSKDSIEYSVKQTVRDFLELKWGQNTINQHFTYTTGITPTKFLSGNAFQCKKGGVCLNLSHWVEEKNEYATFHLMPWSSSSSIKNSKIKSLPNINDFDWHNESERGDHTERYQIEYEFLHNYIVEYHGEPQYVYEGNDITQTTLMEEYNKRFRTKIKSSFYPEEIWVTSNSVICLLRANNYMGGVNEKGICEIIAEPRK
ncbi:MAG: hypothetical protein E6767_11405 [Dysgonomonas sp.]|nr:hypothetical protein [Dysgonomonas sp.]